MIFQKSFIFSWGPGAWQELLVERSRPCGVIVWGLKIGYAPYWWPLNHWTEATEEDLCLAHCEWPASKEWRCQYVAWWKAEIIGWTSKTRTHRSVGSIVLARHMIVSRFKDVLFWELWYGFHCHSKDICHSKMILAERSVFPPQGIAWYGPWHIQCTGTPRQEVAD